MSENNAGIDSLKKKLLAKENFTAVKAELVDSLTRINEQIINDVIENLINIQILPNFNMLNDANNDGIVLQAIHDLMEDTLYDKNQYLTTKNKDNLVKVIGDLAAISNLLNTYKTVTLGFQHIVKEYLGAAQAEVSKELLGFRKNRAASDNARTEDIYRKAVNKYRELEQDYRKYFYWAICITVIVSLGTFCVKKLLVPDLLGNIEFWVVKVTILAVGITLITFFLKQSSHYQRLADQNYQTQVELQAYPSFMESIPTEEAASVRKELALKYFGREIDGAAHKDMSNLISDQMKSTTEMVKAATDALKVKEKV